ACDGADGGAGFFSSLSFARANEHSAVIFDADIGAGVFLELVDHLALWPNDLTDVIDWDLDRQDAWRRWAHVIGFFDDGFHHGQDVHASLPSLCQCRGEVVCWLAFKFGI